jgi:hypothetical protein
MRELATTTYKNLPIAKTDIDWNAGAATKKIKIWATSNNVINYSKYSQAFFWVDSKNKNKQGSYKLPFATILNGRLTAIPRGIYGAAAAIQGARGGVDIPRNDVSEVKNHIAKYYKKLKRKAPWQTKDMNNLIRKTINN